eukprot:CAMPEP_0170517426 /NCGR_PEP_ID=MMETSP0209-20121228/3426_1 /TAXON_ID=665100 ORGANISM="Litonotus pictus, Strain P1" /NCGR_SAMPLE_ID=MMETSP0209 /ASSEMBLY_ACC=CAM_ASM_000301 /LENGTH=520 /DNA_ID=CAMNT_0010802675 /DNA_START=84 /DNA_END=1646 /DNA_ORIENTATION=-
MDEPKQLFKAYYALYEKELEYDINSEIGVKRFKVFSESVEFIKAKNKELGKKTYGITQFTDLTREEFKQKYLMKESVVERIIGETQEKRLPRKVNLEGIEVGEIDWRSKMNPAREQKACGSCWSFAAVASIEGNYNIQYGTLYELSEQYLVDCDTEDNGCNGGYPTRTFPWIMRNGVKDLNDPSGRGTYKASMGICRTRTEKQEAKNIVKGLDYCDKNCTMEQWINLLKEGPILVSMDGDDRALKDYKPESLDNPWVPSYYSCNKINHAVTCVGVKMIDGKLHALVRNSWGKTWGYDGHFTVPLDNSCFIAESAYRPIVQLKGESFPEPECDTFYSDCNKNNRKEIKKCYGIPDAQKDIGFDIAGWSNLEDHHWNVFEKSQCRGKSDWKYKEQQCFATSWSRYRLKEYKSAANDDEKPAMGCLYLHSEPCFAGEQYRICGKVEDLTIHKDFDPSSILSVRFEPFISFPGSVVSAVFFEEKGFHGKACSLKNEKYYNLDEPETEFFVECLKKAKSFAIIGY